MQRLNLIGLSVLLILTSYSKGQKWKVNINRTISATKGLPVIIDCRFEYPKAQHTSNVTLYWKTKGTSNCSKNSNDKSAFLFHPDETCVISRYKGKTKLIGDKTKENCSLLIQSFMDVELTIYLRVAGFNDCYSFKSDPVQISVDGVSPPTIKPDLQTTLMVTSEPVTSTSNNELQTTSNMYLVIFIPLGAVLIIVVIGIIIYAKHKRSQTFTREESGYYVNFSRASANPPKSETLCKTLDVQHPEPKVIDEPIYINTEASTNQMSQGMDPNVYVNVDYSR